MPYPVFLGGDHAAFEQEWAASGRPDSERPDWPLSSFDARDWAEAFCRVVDEKGFDPVEDLDWVQGWFANALMRGYDEHAAQLAKPRKPAPWQIAVLMAVSLVAFIAAVYYASVPCRPGDRGFYIGGVMLMAGCPERRP